MISYLCKIANKLDNLGLYKEANEIDSVVKYLVKAQVPCRQPQIQKEPINQILQEKEAKTEFKFDKKKNKKGHKKNVIEGNNFIFHKKSEDNPNE
jgi:hypothetical protein